MEKLVSLQDYMQPQLKYLFHIGGTTLNIYATYSMGAMVKLLESRRMACVKQTTVYLNFVQFCMIKF
jgi:hypothetical protein